MPSSKSSVDNRDVYYRLGKSAGYRARSAYKLLHLDEEFDLFTNVKTAVDLCAAPGSWSQVLGQALKPGKNAEEAKVVSVDLQPMAPLPNITILQTDITLPSTIPLVLNALGGRKADLVVCDGAPDVTGVHDLDAYLHSQLLLAALTLSLTLLAPGATLIFKIFLSPLDPQAAMLRSQLQLFFPASNATNPYLEFDDSEIGLGMTASKECFINGKMAETGVWVRKPRSSRKGSGEAFIVCRGFDPTRVPLPVVFPLEALQDLANQTTGTLTLDSLSHLTTGTKTSTEWEAIKAYVGSGDLDSNGSPKSEMTLSIDTASVSRHSSVRSIREIHPQPTPCDEPDEYFAPNRDNHGHFLTPQSVEGSRKRVASLKVDAFTSRQGSSDVLTTPSSATSSHIGNSDRSWDRIPSPLPTPKNLSSPESLLSSREWHVRDMTPREDGAVSPALSSSSKTDLFFASSQSEILPTPPKPMARSPNIGRGLPSHLKGHDRAVSLPVMPPKSDVETPHSPPPPPINPIRRPFATNASLGTPRIVSNDIPTGPLSTLPTFPDIAGNVPVSRPLHTRRESQQLSRESREVPIDAAKLNSGDELVPSDDDRRWPADSQKRWRLVQPLGEGAFSSVWAAEEIESSPVHVAAVKLTSRATCASNSRTRIAFLREVSVLRHLSHPNIVSFLASFSTSTHHCLVLERLSGGELFELLSDEHNRERIMMPTLEDASGESIMRRMFGELARGVGWLHEVGVVHRDIKLENIILTCCPFSLKPTATGAIPLDELPSPLVKLTDFGLSRFINLASPSLQTRCGSESFAAPEIIMGRTYDGRETDSWAMGVVLFALIAGELPFDEPDEGRGEREERKRRMMRIAKGQYTWPDGVGSVGARSVVARLLVRDPKKRCRVGDLWGEEWMNAVGGVAPPKSDLSVEKSVSNSGRRRVLDGFLLDEEVEEEAQTEAV